MKRIKYLVRKKRPSGWLGYFTGRRVRILAAVTVSALGGYVLLQSGGAATIAATAEVESATLSGQVSPTQLTSASAGSAVQFGGALSAPTAVEAFTGGNSIAVRWNGFQPKLYNDAISYTYEVYRDGTRIKTISSVQEDFPEAMGWGFVDYNVARGATYRYQVRTLRSDGQASPLSSNLTVVNPSSGYPEPSITLDTSQASNLTSDVNANLIPFMKVWYPKFAKLMSSGQFAPPTEFTVRVATTSPNGVAITSTNLHWYTNGQQTVATVTPSYYATTAKPSLYFSMMSDLITYGSGKQTQTAPLWARKGAVSFGTYALVRHLLGFPVYENTGKKYEYRSATGAGFESGHFLEWLRLKYGPAVLPAYMKSVAYNTYTDNIFQQHTGKTLAQLQEEWQPTTPNRGPAAIRFSALTNACIDVSTASAINSTALAPQVFGCNDSAAQAFRIIHQADPAVFVLRNDAGERCLVAAKGSRPVAPYVASCSGSAGHGWRQNSNGSIESVYFSGYCLESPGGTTAQGTDMTMALCDGSPKQQFSKLP